MVRKGRKEGMMQGKGIRSAGRTEGNKDRQEKNLGALLVCVRRVSVYEKIIISRGAEATARSKAANGDTEVCTHTTGRA